jgi:hypothetical protein
MLKQEGSQGQALGSSIQLISTIGVDGAGNHMEAEYIPSAEAPYTFRLMAFASLGTWEE